MFGHWIFHRIYRWQVGRFFRDGREAMMLKRVLQNKHRSVSLTCGSNARDGIDQQFLGSAN